MLDHKIWFPHYWFVLLTIAVEYPVKANEVTKKKYYELIKNLPLFMPDGEIRNLFIELIEKYPVSPYLEDREGFKSWVHFIYNQYNTSVGNEEKTLYQALQDYYQFYKPKDVVMKEEISKRKKIIFASVASLSIIIGIVLYRRKVFE